MAGSGISVAPGILEAIQYHDMEPLLWLIKKTKIQPSTDSEGPRRSYSPKQDTTSRRAARVINAFANVLVSRLEKEVYAVAIGESDTTVTITLAANGNVPNDVVEFSKSVWERMKEISLEYHNIQLQRFYSR